MLFCELNMVLEMIVWGFFSAMGWMLANYTVDKILPDKPPAVETKIEDRSTPK
jgi:hypothetical protein